MRTKLKITYSYFKIDDRAAVIKTVQCWVNNMIARLEEQNRNKQGALVVALSLIRGQKRAVGVSVNETGE